MVIAACLAVNGDNDINGDISDDAEDTNGHPLADDATTAETGNRQSTGMVCRSLHAAICTVCHIGGKSSFLRSGSFLQNANHKSTEQTEYKIQHYEDQPHSFIGSARSI